LGGGAGRRVKVEPGGGASRESYGSGRSGSACEGPLETRRARSGDRADRRWAGRPGGGTPEPIGRWERARAVKRTRVRELGSRKCSGRDAGSSGVSGGGTDLRCAPGTATRSENGTRVTRAWSEGVVHAACALRLRARMRSRERARRRSEPREGGEVRSACSWIRRGVGARDAREGDVEPGECRRSNRRARDGREEREQRGVGRARAATPGPAAAQAARPTRRARERRRRDARTRRARDAGVEQARRSRRLLRLRARLRSQEEAGRRSEPREGGGLGTHAPGFVRESKRETSEKTAGTGQTAARSATFGARCTARCVEAIR
jgi:hypothetical protein